MHGTRTDWRLYGYFGKPKPTKWCDKPKLGKGITLSGKRNTQPRDKTFWVTDYFTMLSLRYKNNPKGWNRRLCGREKSGIMYIYI